MKKLHCPYKSFQRTIATLVLVSFFCSSLSLPQAQAQGIPVLPAPGSMVHLSPEFTPAQLQGIVIHPENALKFDFIVRKGDLSLDEPQKREEYTKLMKYFLASLAIPDENQWVNLSPYEKDRIIKDDFGKTEMGRDLLAQDYILKQITASLIYPQDKIGQKFWDNIYSKAQQQFGTTNIPVNTFNKVWIVPDRADVYEKGNMAFVYNSHLKVMLEEDYLSLQKHNVETPFMASPKKDAINRVSTENSNYLGNQIIREVVLPELEKEVNEGKNFAMLRQVYSSMILAAWYKRALKESLLTKIYANKAKVKGVDQNPQNNEEIYQQYVKAFKKGAFNYIKEDVDKYSKQSIPRKYFSGGWAAPKWDGPNGTLHRGSDTTALSRAGQAYGDGTAFELLQGAAREETEAVNTDQVMTATARKSKKLTAQDLATAIRQMQRARPVLEDDIEILRQEIIGAATSVTNNPMQEFLLTNAKAIDFEKGSATVDIQGFLIDSKQPELSQRLPPNISSKELATAVREMQQAKPYLPNDVEMLYDEFITLIRSVKSSKVRNFLNANAKYVNAYETRISVQKQGYKIKTAQPKLLELLGDRTMTASKLSVRMGGFMTLEANVAGVNKALALDALDRGFDRILDRIGYTAGPLIDARKTGTVVAADGDGTTYGKPTATENPALADSAAYDDLLEYLRAGGLYMIISGNDLELTRQRIIAPGKNGKPGLPKDLRNRVIVVANGAANMAYINANDEIVEIEDYRNNALGEYRDNLVSSLDLVYLGDDHKPDGNDFPGFKKVGFHRAITVTNEADDKIPEQLRGNKIGGLEAGTGKLLKSVVAYVTAYPNQLVFKRANISSFVATITANQHTGYQGPVEAFAGVMPDGTESRSTMISKESTDTLVVKGGEIIRGFLRAVASHLNDLANSPYVNIKVGGEVYKAAQTYATSPDSFTNEKLLASTGSIRIEVRGKMADGSAAQVAIIGVSGDYRKPGLEILKIDTTMTATESKKDKLASQTTNIININLGKAGEVNRVVTQPSTKTETTPLGGIDFNAANLNLQIKRDGKGVPLPISQQNLENIHLEGLFPVILNIVPATQSPLLAELKTAPAVPLSKA